MVHWIYILECEDGFIYVGQTIHLYARLTQHIGGRGSKNTHNHMPQKLIGLYKVNDNQSFYDYRSKIKNNIFDINIIKTWGSSGDNLLIENRFTERLFYERRNNHEYGTYKEWYRIRGGKYTRDNLNQSMNYAMMMCKNPNRIAGTLSMTTPINGLLSDDIVDRPLCKCNMPSEVKLSKDKTCIYFVCSLKNVWDDFYSWIKVSEPCDFYMVYSDDKIIKAEWDIAKRNISNEQWSTNLPSTRLHNPDPCIKCKRVKYIPMHTWYYYRRVCQSCMVHKYDEIKGEYSYSECLLDD